MPRKPREFEINGIYHVVKRATEGRKMFLKPQDSHRFILGLEFCNTQSPINIWMLLAGSDPAMRIDPTRIGEHLKKMRKRRRKKHKPLVELLAFTLMPNHIHLIIKEIKYGGISKYIQKLGGYSTYFNKQYKRMGSLFQSRFKAVPIHDDVQLNTVFAYVHTNPVALWEPGWKEFSVKNPKKALKKLEEYWPSSYNDYIGNSRFPYVVNRKFFLKFYGNERGCKRTVEDWIRYKAGETEVDPEIIE